MSDRIDLSEDNSLITTITRLQSDLREIRSRQPIDRKLVKRSYAVQTTSDFDVIDDPVPANSFKLYKVNLITSSAQQYPYGILYMDVYNGGRAPANLLSNRGIADSNGVGYQWKPEPSNIPYRMDWSLSVTTGNTAASISMKFRALSTAPSERVFITWV